MIKTFEKKHISPGIRTAVESNVMQQGVGTFRNPLHSEKLSNPEAFSHIITQDRKMQNIFLFMESIAKTNETVLVCGETGVGKELIAKTIHDISRRDKPFIAINVAGLDDTMFTDTLFGHSKGAYTGALESRKGLIQQAGEGTLLLDEIGDLSPSSQVKLLRLLENREYYPLGSDLIKQSGARIIVSTNKDLNQHMKSGQFRNDLYYRLSAHVIWVPPLRERKKDLPLLINYFFQEANEKLTKRKLAIPPELYPLLEAYDFPGNIRELKSMIFDAVSRQSSKMLSIKPFKEIMGRNVHALSKEQMEELITFNGRLPTLVQANDILIAEAMKRAKGVKTIAAVLLGISPPALSKRLNRKNQEKLHQGSEKW